MKFLRWIVSLILVISCGKKQETTHPTEQPITESIYASGNVKSKDQYEVFSAVSGIIHKVLVNKGDHVHKGQMIISLINDAPVAYMENARLSAGYNDISTNQEKLNEVLAEIRLAETKSHNDSLLLVRQQNLWTNGIGSRNDLDNRELAFKNSQMAYHTAILHYEELKKQLRFLDQESKKNLQISQVSANDYIIKARQDGIIYDILKNPGEMVSPQTPVAVIGDADEYILVLQVDEYDIAKVKPGQTVFITMDSYKGQVFEGIITRVIPIMNEQTRTFTAEATFKSAPSNLYPKLTVEANILVCSKNKALTIPRTYLKEDNTVLLKNGKQRKITIGLKDYQKVEVCSGLTINDVIKKPLP